MVISFNPDTHCLINQIAHKAHLTPEEYQSLYEDINKNNVETFKVQIPDWPPVPYAPLHLGGGNAFEGMVWTGIQPAISIFDSNEVLNLAKTLAGDIYSQKRIAYWWQVPEYDETKHILIRQWLAKNEISIVEFYRNYIDKLDHDPIFEVTNPHSKEDIADGGGFHPTVRVIPKEQLYILENFQKTAESFSYDMNQKVSWRRSLDDTRWEARRQDSPQNKTWMSNRSWIQRGAANMTHNGTWTEEDRDPITGISFGPYMELFDDGSLSVWVNKRALPSLKNPIIINGIKILLTPKWGISIKCTKGYVEERNMRQILNNDEFYQRVLDSNKNTAQPEVTLTDNETLTPTQLPIINVNIPVQNKWGRCNPESPLFHRPNGRYSLVVKNINNECEIRVWGDSILSRGLTVNGETITKLFNWNGGWRTKITNIQRDKILKIQKTIENNSPQQQTSSTQEQIQKISNNVKVYSTHSIQKALQKIFPNYRLFGNGLSDTAIVALDRNGIDKFLQINAVNRDQYILDKGNRNYDCENFAEKLRCDLQSRYGINGIGIIWADGHAFNFFVVNNGSIPEILIIEPQTDEVVTELTGNYSINRRCEILL